MALLLFFSFTAVASAQSPANRVLIVLFDQMSPEYADVFEMPNFRQYREAGVSFEQASLGYMCSETVVSHNVIVSGRWPKRQGWVDAVLRDEQNRLGNGSDAIHMVGDLSLSDFGKLIAYPKLPDYVRAKFGAQDGRFIVVGQKSYAVESAAAPSADIAVRMSARSELPSGADACHEKLGGRFRFPAGKNVPTYLTEPYCGRWFVNCESDLGTLLQFPSWLYPADGGHFSPGADPEHLGGDVWVADAAIAMMEKEKWRGMFVTMGGIDKAAHMWGANFDIATRVNCSGVLNDQTHVRCAAEIADQQLGRIMQKLAEVDARDGTTTLVVLTADHGGMVARKFHGKAAAHDGLSNWIYAPNGIFQAGVKVTDVVNKPAPALAPLVALKNVRVSYQSTAIQVFLDDRSAPAVQRAVGAVAKMPSVIAVYELASGGAAYKLSFVNDSLMTSSERGWWTSRAQGIVDAMASSASPDVVGLLQDDASYGVFGDHGGHQERVQRVPVVFWHKGIAAQKRADAFRHVDIMPTVAAHLGLTLTTPADGRALSLAPPATPAPPAAEPPSSATLTIVLISVVVYLFCAACAVASIKFKNLILKKLEKRKVTRV
jgi:hypothetical protein